jgi:hypothetical protein
VGRELIVQAAAAAMAPVVRARAVRAHLELPVLVGARATAWRKTAPADWDRGRPDDFAPDTWVDDGPVRDQAEAAVGRATSSPRRRTKLPDEVDEEVARVAGPAWAGRVKDRLAEAVRAYEGERYRDARRILEGLLERVPSSVAVRELYGLTLYRMGRWRDATRELGAVEMLTGSVDHHPVIADSYRALGNNERVRELWDELRRTGASVDVLVEGRIVMAGALADAGDPVRPTGGRRPRFRRRRGPPAVARRVTVTAPS